MQSNDRERRGPTVAQLKDDIDSGRTGDKVAAPDPGLSPLGTDDEAAGTPPTAERIALARRTENRWAGSATDRTGSRTHYTGAMLVTGGIALLAIALAAPVWIKWLW